MIVRQAQKEDARAIAKVHVDSWRTTYAAILSNSFLASLSYEEREQTWGNALSLTTNQSFIYVAETSEHEIIGFACAGPEREANSTYTGEIYALYLLQSYQRQGIGRILFKDSVKELKQRGITSLLIWVLAENPSRAFYQALGGIYLQEKIITIGEQQLIEVAYGWRETQTIIDA